MKTTFGALGLGDEFRFKLHGEIFVKAVNEQASVNRGGGMIGARSLVKDAYKRGYISDSAEVFSVEYAEIYQKPFTREDVEGLAELGSPLTTAPKPEQSNAPLTLWTVRFKGECGDIVRKVHDLDRLSVKRGHVATASGSLLP